MMRDVNCEEEEEQKTNVFYFESDLDYNSSLERVFIVSSDRFM